MDVERAQLVEKLYEQALDRPPGEREPFLARACGDDAEVRAEIQSLLAQQEQTPADFMQWPEPDGRPPSLAASATSDHLIGCTIARYLVKGVINRGGMGIVYEAVQAQPHRTVALKVMRHGITSRSALRRFRFEAEVLGHLRHPNVAQVYEAGIDDDGTEPVPFFAMEYVPEANPLTDYADIKQLNIRQRVSLFTKVCEGVHHGHQKGIIHRDLKPGNILVDSSGEPKIIDFGIARSTGSDIAITTMQTDVGQLLGTLQYMSPEQCDADPLEIDTRCDVYALGAVLYELLAGRTPYDVSNMTIHAASRVICEQPAERPSHFAPSLKGYLDAIILKALAKRREDRYASVAELASDLRAFLHGEPIQARPPTPWQRATVWAMRHPKAMAVLTSLLIVTGIVGSIGVAIIKVKRDFDMQPGQLVFNDEGKPGEAILLSRSGKTIHRWGSPGRRMIAFATLYTASDGASDTTYAILGGVDPQSLDDPNGVNVYEVTRGKVGIPWTDRVLEEDLPDSVNEEGYPGSAVRSFHAVYCWLLDVFPSRPGTELVVVFSHMLSRRMLVVYDVGTGERLYRVWHDGTIRTMAFLTEPGLLLLVAEDARAYLEEMDYAAEEIRPPGAKNSTRYPMMMVALKPKIGVTEPAFIALTEGMDGVRPVWIRWWTPLWAQDVVELLFDLSPSVSDADTQARCGVTYIESGAVFGFDVDQDGREVRFSRVPDDAYHLYRGDAPEHDIFQLCDRLPEPGEQVPPGECPVTTETQPSSSLKE